MERPLNVDGGEKSAGGREGSHKTILGLIESGVSDPDGFGFGAVSGGSGDALNAIGGVATGNVGVGKSVRAQTHGIVIGVGESKVRVEDVDSAVWAVIGSEKKGIAGVGADGQTGVDRADARAVNLKGSGAGALDDRINRGIPSADST